MRICIYAIMCDEEDNVAAWASTAGDATSRFVLDTGSSDATHDLLHANEIEHAKAHFFPFRFDDARNTALALAPPADLYMRLDADERLEPGWREQLEAVYQPDFARYRVTVQNHGNGWDRITRDDIHQRQGHRWKYPTHEVLVGPGMVRHTDITVHHHPPIERRPHHNANLDTLRDAIDEYPGDHRMAFYYARELWYAGQWDRCRPQMMAFLAMPGGWPPERAEAYRILAAIDYEPERWLWKAIGESPERREPWVDLTRHYLEIGRDEAAVTAMNFAYHRNDRTIYTTDQRAWDDPFHELLERVNQIDVLAAHANEP